MSRRITQNAPQLVGMINLSLTECDLVTNDRRQVIPLMANVVGISYSSHQDILTTNLGMVVVLAQFVHVDRLQGRKLTFFRHVCKIAKSDY
jgi:hypothetical protein